MLHSIGDDVRGGHEIIGFIEVDFPNTGFIRADADMVIWDPKEIKTIDTQDVISKSGFSIYEGWEVTGWPIISMVRGVVAYENNTIVGQPGSGKYVRSNKR